MKTSQHWSAEERLVLDTDTEWHRKTTWTAVSGSAHGEV